MNFDVKQFSSDKILKHLDRVNAWIEGKNPPPITVEFDMTNICNHRCPECSGMYFQNNNNDMLSEALAKDILKQLAEAGVRGLIFTGGGEPLCNPKTPKMVMFARNIGLEIGFITNGTLITEDIAAILVDACIWIRVSIDAATPDTYQKTHGMPKEAFDKVLDNLKMLVETKKRRNSSATVGVGFLTSKYTKGDMLEAAKLFKHIGTDYLQFRPMQIHDNDRFSYDPLDIDKDVEACINENTNGYTVLFSQHKYRMMKERNYGRNYGKCFGHQFAAVVGADAKMYLCCHMRGHEEYCIGDLTKNTFREIWDSEQRRHIAENIDFNDCVPLCRDNTFNQILWNISQPREHENFL